MYTDAEYTVTLERDTPPTTPDQGVNRPAPIWSIPARTQRDTVMGPHHRETWATAPALKFIPQICPRATLTQDGITLQHSKDLYCMAPTNSLETTFTLLQSMHFAKS